MHGGLTLWHAFCVRNVSVSSTSTLTVCARWCCKLYVSAACKICRVCPASRNRTSDGIIVVSPQDLYMTISLLQLKFSRIVTLREQFSSVRIGFLCSYL